MPTAWLLRTNDPTRDVTSNAAPNTRPGHRSPELPNPEARPLKSRAEHDEHERHNERDRAAPHITERTTLEKTIPP